MLVAAAILVLFKQLLLANAVLSEEKVTKVALTLSDRQNGAFDARLVLIFHFSVDLFCDRYESRELTETIFADILKLRDVGVEFLGLLESFFEFGLPNQLGH